MERLFKAFTLAVLLPSVLSCSKQGPENPDGRLLFSVTSGGTRCEVTKTESLNQEGNTFLLDAWLESENRQAPGRYDDNAHPRYIKSSPVSLTGGVWTNDTLTWRNRVQTNFWATYPVDVKGRGPLTWPASESEITDAQQKTPSFTYDMTEYAAVDTAFCVTPDILSAYCRQMWDDDRQEGGTVKLEFQHLLSGIRFKMGTATDEDGNDIDVIFKKISICGIYGKATCNMMTPISDYLNIDWEPDTTAKLTFTQTFSEELIGKGDYFLPSDKYLFLIPQKTPLAATFKCDLRRDDIREEIVGQTAQLFQFVWKPGYIYDYTLSYSAAKGVQVASVKVDVRPWTVEGNQEIEVNPSL